MAPATPLVSVRKVCKRYANGTLALSDVDLDLGTSEFVSLLGPSGCGKSTLLRLIAGLGEPTTGRIDRAGGRDALNGGLSFVFQEPTLMPWATALANAQLPLRLAGVPLAERTERAREALASVGLAGFEQAYPRELSGGMKMRVSIARALVTRPRLLLMDEPFAALDEITRTRLNHDLLALWEREKFTVVFVTHSVYESVFLSQRVVVLAARPGRIADVLQTDAPYPRGPAYRTTPAYAAHCERASAALEACIGACEPATL